jgi:hypothetical protein
MKIDTLKNNVLLDWRYLISRDLSFWSVVTTLLLVLITLALAVATKQMADVMSRDYMVRTMPVFRTTTPQVTTNEKETIFTFMVANVSQGIAKGTIHHVYIEDTIGNIVPVQNVTVGKGHWAKKLNEIPIDYVSGTKEIIKLTWPLTSVSPQKIETVVIVLKFKTLFDEKLHRHIEGFVYESDHNNLDPMTQDRLSHVLEKIEKKTGRKIN